jgi:hypothetical protein
MTDTSPIAVKRTLPIRLPNSAYRVREYLTEKEVDRLIEAAKRRGRNGARDAAAILLAYRGDILRSPDFECDDFETERAGRRLNLLQLQHSEGIAHIAHDRQPVESGDNLAQKFEPLASKIGRHGCQASDVAARSRQIGELHGCWASRAGTQRNRTERSAKTTQRRGSIWGLCSC